MSKNNKLISFKNIQDMIFTIRGVQVMLDRNLAEVYQVETRALKQAVKRNNNRFPSDFMFQLNDDEIELVVSQSVIPSKKHLGGAKPFAFTEQCVAALSSVLTSDIAVETSIKLMRAFVEMRRFLQTNTNVFTRLDLFERRQIAFESETQDNFEKIFKALEAGEPPRQGIFYDGQVYDAYTFVSDLIRKAKKSITLIDNYIDDSVLTLLSKHKKEISATIYTKTISKQLTLDLKKYNEQYPPITITIFKDSHDRFLIIDEKEIYHIGASLKDLGKKWFAFSKFEASAVEILGKLGKTTMKSEVGSLKGERKSDLPKHSFELAKRIVLLCHALDERSGGSRTLAKKLLRSGNSLFTPQTSTREVLG